MTNYMYKKNSVVGLGRASLASCFVVMMLGCSTKLAVVDPVPASLQFAETNEEKVYENLVDPSAERLVLAARYGQTDTVTYLLDGGMEVDARDAYANTALIAAASNGHSALVAQLLELGANIEAKNKEELSALMGASVKGHFEVVNQLIEAGAKVDGMNNDGETSLFLAVKYGHFRAAKVLLNSGAKPNITNTIRANVYNSGFSPLMYAVTYGVTTRPVEWNSMAEVLLQNGADPNLSNTHGDTAMVFARNKEDQQVVATLKRFGAKDGFAYSALSMDDALIKAIRLGDLHQVRFLLPSGANANFVDKNGITPLMAAAFENEVAALELLVDAGAEVNFVTTGLRQFALSKSHAPLSERALIEAASRGDTALNVAVRKGNLPAAEFLLDHEAKVGLANRLGEPPLLIAATEGNADLVKLLLSRDADENSLEQDSRANRMALVKQAVGRNSVLIAATQKGHLDVVQLLVEAGADINYRGFMGKTALHVAVERNRRNLVSYLSQQAADPNIASLAGITPLMEAAKMGNRYIVTSLLQAEANPNIIEQPDLGYASESSESTGMTALMFAARSGHDDVVSQLLQAGAERNIHNSDGKRALDEAVDAGYDEVVQLLDGSATDGSGAISLFAVDE